MFYNVSEENYVLSTLNEFVKLWGSGNQANFEIECKNGQAWVKLSSFLGHPSDRHFVPHFHQQVPAHGPHGAPPAGGAKVSSNLNTFPGTFPQNTWNLIKIRGVHNWDKLFIAFLSINFQISSQNGR